MVLSSSDWIAIMAAAAAVGSALVAVWQARSAARSGREAGALLERAVAAQERMAETMRKNAWGVPKFRAGEWSVRNSSGRAMRVHRVDVDPPQFAALLTVEGDLPLVVASGDMLHFTTAARVSAAVRKITIVWGFLDSDGTEYSSVRTLG